MTTIYERITDKKIEEIVADIQYYLVIDDKEKAEMLLRTLALLRTPPHTDTEVSKYDLRAYRNTDRENADPFYIDCANETIDLCIEIVKKQPMHHENWGHGIDVTTLITALEALKK